MNSGELPLAIVVVVLWIAGVWSIMMMLLLIMMVILLIMKAKLLMIMAMLLMMMVMVLMMMVMWPPSVHRRT